MTRSIDAAKSAKNDEFYTQWRDIEQEVNAYLERDEDLFRDRVVLLPCDDPEWSNFVKYFALHFSEYGIKKLISTSYAPKSNHDGDFYRPTLFEEDDPKYDPAKSVERGRIFVLDRTDVNNDGRVDLDDLRWDYLEGDGDFRSDEVTALRDEADIIFTNPPFSLFREFLAWMRATPGMLFAVIGNSNATTYKEVYPLIQNNEIWKGATGNSSDMVFAVPKGSDIKDADRKKAEKMGYPPSEKYDFTRMGSSCWYTNIEHGIRHEPIPLLDMADQLRYSAHSEIIKRGYIKYENADAIEVPYVDAIPGDYAGLMGVPITFIDQYNPEQFEIVGFRKGDDGKDLRVMVDGVMKSPYFRILVKLKG